jgi:hypothetical protein
MKLKLLIEHTGQSFTLKPETKYIVGSALDCTINLPNIDGIAERHIALSLVDNAWLLEDLNSTNGTFVNGQAINSYKINAPVRIALAGNFLIAAAPLVPEIAPIANVPTQPIQPPTYQPPISPPPVYGNNPPPVYTSQSVSNPSPYNDPYSSVSSPPIQPSIPSPRNQFNKKSPQVMTWWDFIDRQVEKGQSWLDQVAIRYFMTTGLRSTPWISLSGGCGLDGYIIPDFKERADEVAAGIAANLDQLRQYPDTDCCIVWLTDAHIANIQPSPVLGVPIKRAGRKDFRRFCVVSHHRIRTYVIIDNYGSDLFVGRFTRFEAQLNGFPLLLWGIIFAILTLFLSFGSSFFLPFAGDLRASVFIWLLIIFSGFWFGTFIGIPLFMRQLNVLPVATNLTGIVILILTLVTIFFALLKILFPG